MLNSIQTVKMETLYLFATIKSMELKLIKSNVCQKKKYVSRKKKVKLEKNILRRKKITAPQKIDAKKNAYFFILYLISYLHSTNDAHGQRFCSKG